jgi:hypothetical protein
MDEDVLGPRQTVIGQRYDNCTRCDRPIPRQHVMPLHQAGEGPTTLSPDLPGVSRPAEATMDGPPARLCPDCMREVSAGEPLERLSEPGDAPERTL